MSAFWKTVGSGAVAVGNKQSVSKSGAARQQKDVTWY